MESIWWQTAQHPTFTPLKGSIKTDVLIIGGGLTGVLCAHRLRRQGVNCVVAEATTVGGGITKNTTAKLTLQHGALYDRLIRTFGRHRAQLYLQAQQAALEEYRWLCREIVCDYTTADAYVYSLTDRLKMEKEAAALETLGCSAEFLPRLSLPLPVVGAVRMPEQAQFHPLRFLYALAKGLPIYEHTPIRELVSGGAVTPRGTITADKIIVATHFPFLNKHGAYFLKLYQHRSYVLALKGAPMFEGMYVDENDKGMSFRRYGDLLLLGGGGHRTGKQGGGWQELEDFARRRFPRAQTVYRWATQDCMSLDGVPYIGSYAPGTPELYVATGYNKWGMSNAMVASMVLSDMVCGRENPWAEVFAPDRSIWRPQLAINSGEAMRNLLTLRKPRCPHMGCALHYNPQEHSWDCSCHGSRFTEEGQLIDGPATTDTEL